MNITKPTRKIRNAKEKVSKSSIQMVMNTTRNKLNKGKFNEDDYEIKELIVKTNKIPREFNNYKIVHITDIHIGQWITQEKLDGIIRIINKLKADAIVITGDYVSYQTSPYIDQLQKSLSKLKAKDCILSVLGNHDHDTEPENIKDSLRKSNIINLENEVYTITRNAKKLQIAGVDSITVEKDDINKVLQNLDYNTPAIMLVHEPDFADTTSKYEPFILQLSGHSHGGQINIPKVGTPIRGPNFKKYPSGTYKVNNMLLYTNNGLGTNNFWIRINCPPEITKIILKTEE